MVSVSWVNWPKSHRLIPSQYPPIDLFDDIADPADWELLAAAQAKTNPRIHEQIGNLSYVPVERGVSGSGASWIMAAFTHVSQNRQSRFSDGSYGVYYCAQTTDTAIYETAYHQGRFPTACKLSYEQQSLESHRPLQLTLKYRFISKS